jgi:hypothetical protein
VPPLSGASVGVVAPEGSNPSDLVWNASSTAALLSSSLKSMHVHQQASAANQLVNTVAAQKCWPQRRCSTIQVTMSLNNSPHGCAAARSRGWLGLLSSCLGRAGSLLFQGLRRSHAFCRRQLHMHHQVRNQAGDPLCKSGVRVVKWKCEVMPPERTLHASEQYEHPFRRPRWQVTHELLLSTR